MVDVQYSPVHNILPNAYLKAWKVEQFTFHFFTGILFLAILLRYFQHFSRTYWKLILFSLERFLIGPGWMKGKWKKVSPFPGSFAWKSHKKCPIFHTQVCNSQEKLRNTNITCAVCRENVSWRNWRLSRLFVNNQNGQKFWSGCFCFSPPQFTTSQDIFLKLCCCTRQYG